MKSPKYLQPQTGLTATQRKSLGLEKVAPRERAPGEATSVVICNSNTMGTYRTGYGEVAQPLRQGSDVALKVRSRGIGA